MLGRITKLLALLAVLAGGSAFAQTFTVQQQAPPTYTNSTSATNVNVMPSNLTPGSTLVLVIHMWNNGNVSGPSVVSSLTDTAGLTFVQQGLGSESAINGPCCANTVVYTALNPSSSAAETVSVTTPLGGTQALFELTATGGSGLIYPFAPNYNYSGGGTTTTGTLTTVDSSTFLLGYAFDDYGTDGTWTPNSGWSLQNYTPQSAGRLMLYNQTAAVPGTYDMSISYSGATNIRSVHVGMVGFRIVTQSNNWLQGNGCFSNSSTTVTCALNSNTSGNSTLVVTGMGQGGTSVPALTISGCGASWTLDADVLNLSGGAYTSAVPYTWHAYFPTSTSCSVTITDSGATTIMTALLSEYSGYLTFVSPAAYGYSNNPVSTSYTAAQNNTLVYGTGSVRTVTGPLSFIPPTGFAMRDTVTSSTTTTTGTGISAFDDVLSTGSYSPSFSWNGTYGDSNNALLLVPYLRSASPPTSSQQPFQMIMSQLDNDSRLIGTK